MTVNEPAQDQKKTSRLFKEIAFLFRLQTGGGVLLAIFWMVEYFSQTSLPLYLSNAIESLLVGALGLVSLLLFNRHKGMAVIGVSIGAIAILNAYSVLVSHGLDIVLTAFEAIILVCLIVLKNRKEL
jgi:hypothetical protein